MLSSTADSPADARRGRAAKARLRLRGNVHNLRHDL